MTAAEAPGPRPVPSAEFLAWVAAERPDWDRQAIWDALHACKSAGWEWKRTVTRMVALVFGGPATEPRELRDEARATRPRAQTGPLVFARGLALARAAIEPHDDSDQPRQEAGTSNQEGHQQ